MIFKSKWYYIFSFVLLVCCVEESKAQKNDYIWLSGYDSQVGYDSAWGFSFGATVLNFNYQPVNISYDSIGMNFFTTNTSYCDNNGNLLFYTNGIYIADSSGTMIVNSAGINQGWLDEDWDPTIQTYGYRNRQGIIALPDLNSDSLYYLVHSYSDSVPGSQEENIYTPQILSTYFNKFANNGQGNVIYKNRTLLQGDLGQQVPAVKHGNGKDWWLLIQSRNTNCFYPVLLTDTGLQVMASQTCGGQPVGDTDITSVAFSPDGSKFAHFAVYGGLNIYNFDRCTGELSSPIYYPLDIAKDSSWLGNGIAFSPNSRFLYVSATKIVLQFDMWASNILASIDTVAVYDGFKFPLGSYFDEAQLGPDGKIYISCGNSELDYHVIKNPDGKGDSCSFAQHSILLTSPSVCVPYFPNYRLGALTGSACDTITGLNEVARAAKEQILKVFPNPATDITTVDYGFTDWNKTQPNLEICNTLGQTVYSQVLPMYSGFQKIDVSRFADGMYTVFIKRDNVVVATQKLVKQ